MDWVEVYIVGTREQEKNTARRRKRSTGKYKGTRKKMVPSFKSNRVWVVNMVSGEEIMKHISEQKFLLHSK